jgi:glycosyltransferase involved in cell wall biosynthesis
MKLVIVIPCFNEREALPFIVPDLVHRCDGLICVDDGSTDDTWQWLTKCVWPNLECIHIPHGGHQRALLEGLLYAKGKSDCVITMDADGQHDPRAIPDFIAKYKEGADIVYGVRRRNPSFFSRLFYALNRGYLVPNHGDYRLISAKVLDTLTEDSEPFLRGLFANTSFKTAIVEYDEQPRIAGKPTYSLRKRIGLGWMAIKWRWGRGGIGDAH